MDILTFFMALGAMMSMPNNAASSAAAAAASAEEAAASAESVDVGTLADFKSYIGIT